MAAVVMDGKALPFTSTKKGPCGVSRRKSNRESSQVNSGRTTAGSGRKCSAHSPKTLLGAWASMLMSRDPFSTATRS